MLTSLLVFGAALALYVATLAPGLLWGGGDFAKFQTWAFLGWIEGKVDIFAHPLWPVVAHPFMWLPIRGPAWRANFASAVFASAALVFVFRSACRTASPLAALLATGALAVSHTFWTYAVTPKVYSLNALLLATTLYLVLCWRATARERYLVLFAVLYGLSFLNHLVMSTAAAGFAAFIVSELWKRRRMLPIARSLALVAGGFAVGFAPYLVLMLGSSTAIATGRTAGGFIVGVLHAASHPTAALTAVAWGVALGLYQFPATSAVGVLGWYRLWRRDATLAATLGLIMLGTAAFLLGAADPDSRGAYVWNLHYYLQAYVAFAIAMAPGFEVIWTTWCGRRRVRQGVVVALTLALPVVLYAAAPAIARRVVRQVPGFRPLPGRDNFAYVLSPWKQNETGARDLTTAIFAALPPNSVLFADYSIWSILHYTQVVEHARPDVKLVRLGTKVTQVPVMLRYREAPHLFLADTYRYYDLDGIGTYFDIQPAGPIYRLIPKSRH